MVAQLPEDIVHLLCDELYNREDLASLFHLAGTSRHLAPLALAALYRKPRPAGDSDESVGYDANSLLIVQKWSISWRSIILSTFDQTLYPYCKFLRELNLMDLQELLEDDNFKNKIADGFFTGELAGFYAYTWAGLKRRRKVLDTQAIVESVGDALAPRASMVEHLAGHNSFSSDACSRWIRHLPRLRSLQIWDGTAIVSKATHKAIYDTCPKFESLEMHHSLADDSDHSFGAFLGALPPRSLRNFHAISNCRIASETCLGLTAHSQSLTDLNLTLTVEGIPTMGFLRACTAVETLRLEIYPDTELEATQNDVFKEISAWFRDCKQLKSLVLWNFKDAPRLLLSKLLESPENLEDLSVFARGQSGIYAMRDNAPFHQALCNLHHLRALNLLADPEDSTRDDIDTLITSLAKLPELRSLTLRGVSDYFNDTDTITLLASLPNLEDVYLTGLSCSDEVLQVIPNLSNVRQVQLAAYNSAFTSLGIKQLIDRLGPGNEGLELNISFADPESMIPDGDIQVLRDALVKKVGLNGRLEYQATRDPNVSEFEGESD